MKEIFTELNAAIKRGEDTVLATVIFSSGATPRGAGARMLVSENGRLAGTVGGGAVEFRSIQYAREICADRQSGIQDFRLRKNDIEDIGMICGGDASIHFLFLDASDPLLRELADQAMGYINRHLSAWLITDLSVTDSLGLALYLPEKGNSDISESVFTGYKNETAIMQKFIHDELQFTGPAFALELEGRKLFVEELAPPGFVYIFGGGHVGQALVPALAAVNFTPVILDDRKEFVDPDLFPEAFATIFCDLDNIAGSVEITDRDYACVMTRGHTNDLEVQAQLLRTPARYIGVIGSRTKTKITRERLKERGFTEEDFARITAPIGLDLGGKTPAEIAVSITAQLIRERSKDYLQGN